MTKKQLNQFSVAITILFAFAPLAHAAIIAGGSADIDIKTEGMPVVKSTISLGATATPTPHSGVKMEDGMEMHTQMKGEDKNEAESDGKGSDMMHPGHATGTMRAMEMSNEHAMDALEKAELHVDLGASEDAEDEAMTKEIDSAAKVHSSHEFEHFVAHKAKDDEHLKGVEVSGGKMKVTYEEPAKLFGFWKTTIKADTVVDATGNVEVSYPWYHIFMKKQVAKESLRSDIARAIAAERKAEKEGMATTTIEAKIEASMGIPNLFEIITNTLKASSVKAEAEVKAE